MRRSGRDAGRTVDEEGEDCKSVRLWYRSGRVQHKRTVLPRLVIVMRVEEIRIFSPPHTIPNLSENAIPSLLQSPALSWLFGGLREEDANSVRAREKKSSSIHFSSPPGAPVMYITSLLVMVKYLFIYFWRGGGIDLLADGNRLIVDSRRVTAAIDLGLVTGQEKSAVRKLRGPIC